MASLLVLWLTACGGGGADSQGVARQANTAKPKKKKKAEDAGTASLRGRANTASTGDADPPGDLPIPAGDVGGALAGRAEMCPRYTASPLYRARQRQIRVTPGDDWIAAVEGAPPGTEVVFAAGEYRIGDELNIDVGAQVTLRGETGDPRDVVLTGDGYDVEVEGVTLHGAEITIADLSVTQIRHHAIFIKGEGAHAPHLYNVRLYDVGTQHVKLTPGGARDGVIACSEMFFSPGAVRGDYIDAVDLHEAIDWTIRDNYMHDIEGDHTGCAVDISCETYVSGPAILVWNNSRGTIIERNVLIDNFRNIALGLRRGHDGGVVRNNFIWRSGAGEGGIELEGAKDTRVVNNTIFVAGYVGAVEVRDASRVDVVNNLMNLPIWDRGGSSFAEDGNIDDARDSDFATPGAPALAPGSRAVRAAALDPDAPQDIDGQDRPARADVGCDQAG